MNQTNPKKLRAELKDYLDLAEKEPVRIVRRTGDSFILISENAFSSMQSEILSLQRRLLGMADILQNNTKEYNPGDKSRQNRFKGGTK